MNAIYISIIIYVFSVAMFIWSILTIILVFCFILHQSFPMILDESRWFRLWCETLMGRTSETSLLYLCVCVWFTSKISCDHAGIWHKFQPIILRFLDLIFLFACWFVWATPSFAQGLFPVLWWNYPFG